MPTQFSSKSKISKSLKSHYDTFKIIKDLYLVRYKFKIYDYQI